MNPHDSKDQSLNCRYTFNDKNEKDGLKYLFIIGCIILLLFVIGKSVLATTYYVSSSGGLNTNNGTSILTPWQTFTRVESQTLLPGDSVLFKAGDVWRDILNVNQSGVSGNYIYFGRYGLGQNPRFLGSTKAETWTATATTNVWQSATSLINTSDDYYAGRMFFLTDDSVTWGVYKAFTSNFSNLTQEFDYCVGDAGTHYVYATSDPDSRYDSIEVTQREQCISLNFRSYFEFNGIDIKFGQRQGVYEGYPARRGQTDLVFRNCVIGYIGSQGSGAAYGLATYYSNLLIENCFFSDCGRRAISINTYENTAGGTRVENVIIRNNTFKRGYHTTSLDLSTMNRTGDTVMNVYFYNNVVDDHERTSSIPTSNWLFTQGGVLTSRMTGIYIFGNIFIQSTAAGLNLENSITHYIWNNTFIAMNPSKTTSPYGTIAMNGIDTIDLRNNIFYDNLPDNALENNLVHGYPTPDVYFKHRDYNLYYTLFPKADRNFTSVNIGGTRTFWRTTQWTEFKAAFPAWEVHSPTPQNPNFIDYNNYDFRLTSTSIATRTGEVLPYIIVTDPFGVVDTINKYDINGNIRSRIKPSLGAYEYPFQPRVLFIGNSFSGYGPLYTVFQSLAVSLGYPAPIVSQSISTGQTLTFHRTNSTTMSYINHTSTPNNDLDFVVLQDASTRAYADSLTMRDDILWFYDTIKVNNPGAKVVLYETWSTLNPSSLQDTWYSNHSPILLAQLDGLQSTVRRAYENAALNITTNSDFAIKTDTIISRVGDKWNTHLHSSNPFRLHLVNDIHPNDAGIYLNGLTMVNHIYNTPVAGASYLGLTESQALHLQDIVDSSFSNVEEPYTPSSATAILNFFIPGQISSTISLSNHTVLVRMPFSTNLSYLIPQIQISSGAVINPVSGASRNFNTPQSYTVTAEDGVTQQVWVVTVNTADRRKGMLMGLHTKINGKWAVL